MTKKKRRRKEERRATSGRRKRQPIAYWVPMHGDGFAAWKRSEDGEALLFAYMTKERALEGTKELVEAGSPMKSIVMPAEEMWDGTPPGAKGLVCCGLTGERFAELLMKSAPVMVVIDEGFPGQEVCSVNYDESGQIVVTPRKSYRELRPGESPEDLPPGESMA